MDVINIAGERERREGGGQGRKESAQREEENRERERVENRGRERKREEEAVGRGPRTMSNIAGLFHPWEREPERGGWLTGVEARRGSGVREPRERVQRREERRSISVPPPSPFRHSHFSPRSALHHSASHPPSFIPLSSLGSDTVPWLCFSLFRGRRFSRFSADDSATLRSLLRPATLLIALSKFISQALVGGLPEFDCRELKRRVDGVHATGKGWKGWKGWRREREGSAGVFL